MQVPQLEQRSTIVSLKDNMKMIVITMKAIKESIAQAEADKKHDHSDAIEQLNINLKSIVNIGTEIMQKVKIIESRNETALLSIPT